jgi:transmembrane 9 superfamily protein 2/4
VSKVRPSKSWDAAAEALHGDAIYQDDSMSIQMLQDVYCGQLCVIQDYNMISDAISQDLRYNWIVDGMPVAVRHETQSDVSIRYWGGVPVGTTGGDNLNDGRFSLANTDDKFLYNHYTIEILYWESSPGNYRILRTTVQPFSIEHTVQQWNIWPAVPMINPILSCKDRSQRIHTHYNLLNGTNPLKVPANGPVLLTYDVIWTRFDQAANNNPSLSRWNVFLQMDDAVPMSVPAFGLAVALVVNAFLLFVLCSWVARDLGYKPLMTVMAQDAETSDQRKEMELWPLSRRLFYVPRYSLVLCFLSGTGGQLFLSGFCWVVFFRCGVINQSLGYLILTPVVVLYVFASPFGGYITGRMAGMFYRTQRGALIASGCTATILPLVSMAVMQLVYDTFPNQLSPAYHVLAHAFPIMLVWLFCIIPLTLIGGYYGHKHGPWNNFPISKSASTRYHDDSRPEQDLDEDNDRSQCAVSTRRFLTKYRLPCLFLIGGLPPMICSFVEYAYGVAGPVYNGYFSNIRSFSISSFILFNTAIACVAGIAYYRQIRSLHHYHWWWASFTVGASSGFYVFLLSISWLGIGASGRDVTGGMFAAYFLWFVFCSSAVGIMSGFIAVFGIMIFTRVIYGVLKRRQYGPDGEESFTSLFRERKTRTHQDPQRSDAESDADTLSHLDEADDQFNLNDVITRLRSRQFLNVDLGDEKGVTEDFKNKRTQQSGHRSLNPSIKDQVDL